MGGRHLNSVHRLKSLTYDCISMIAHGLSRSFENCVFIGF